MLLRSEYHREAERERARATAEAHRWKLAYGGVEQGQASPNRGLGLYFCRLVVEAHGGHVWALEPSDGGVVFEIRVPGVQARRPL